MASKRLLTFPFTKFTKLADGRLLVEGTATSEALDCQGDILDYEGSKKAFDKWTGNVRESHDPKKAVGKRLGVTCDDATRTITVKAFISSGAPNTQRLIEDGVLKAYSVGGDPKQAKLEKRDGREVRRITEWDMVELSVVDVGANPDSNDLVLCKSDGATEALGDEIVESPVEEPNRFAKALADAGITAEAAPVPPPVASPLPAGATLSRVYGKGGYLGSLDLVTGTFKAAAPTISKSFEWGMPEDDLYCALDCLRSLRYLKSCEMAEGEGGDASFIEAAIVSLCQYIAGEAGELVTELAEPGESLAAETTGEMEMARKPRGLSTLRLSRQLAEIQKALATPPAPAPALIEPLTPKDGEQIVVALGKDIAKVSATLVKAVGELKDSTAVELKAIRDQVDVIAAQPMPGGPAKRQPPATMTAASRVQKTSAILAGLAESLPDAGSRAALRNRAMAFEQSGD